MYDGIFPIVDYTNLFILGITCALAWELPESPVHLSEDLMEKYKNGTLPLLLRMDTNIVTNSSAENSIDDYGYDSFYKPNSKFDFHDWDDDGAKLRFGSKFFEPWHENHG